MTAPRIAHPNGVAGETPSFRPFACAATGEASGHSLRPVLRSPNGETTLHLMPRHHILCTEPRCVERAWYELREMGAPVSWWCLDHAIARMEAVGNEEAAAVRAAEEWAA